MTKVIYKLSDVMNIIGGGTPKRSIKEYWNGNIHWLSIDDFKSVIRYVETSKEKITKLGLDKSSTKLLQPGMLVISARGTVGEIAQLKSEVAFNQSCYGIDAKDDFLENDYLYYLLKFKIRELQSIAHGSVFDTITRDTFDHIEVSLPTKSNQKAIAHILGTLDDKIETNQKMNNTLEDIAKTTFKSWFVDFDPVRAKAEGRPTGLSPEISDLFPEELVDTEIGEIPLGWDVLKVKEEAVRLKVGKLYSNKTVEDEGAIPVLDQSDDGIIGYHSNDEFVSASVENPVFTFANHTCKMRLMFSDFGVIQNVIPLQSKSYPTIWFYLRTLGIQKFEEYKGHIPDFMETKLSFPTVQLANSLNQLVTPLFHRIDNANRENKVLGELRDKLLPKLISGELRIPDAEKFLEEAGI